MTKEQIKDLGTGDYVQCSDQFKGVYTVAGIDKKVLDIECKILLRDKFKDEYIYVPIEFIECIVHK